MRYFALLSSLGYVLAGCGVSSAERPLATDDDRARTIEYIDSVNAAYSAARHKGDAASAAQMYAENAIFMRPGAHDLQGRAAIEAEIATWGAEVEGRAARDTIFVHGDRAYEVARGSWHDPKTGNRAHG